MHTKAGSLNAVKLPEVNEMGEKPKSGAAPCRREFVEPEVSFPIDVLESTTFFQFTESGVSN